MPCIKKVTKKSINIGKNHSQLYWFQRLLVGFVAQEQNRRRNNSSGLKVVCFEIRQVWRRYCRTHYTASRSPHSYFLSSFAALLPGGWSLSFLLFFKPRIHFSNWECDRVYVITKFCSNYFLWRFLYRLCLLFSCVVHTVWVFVVTGVASPETPEPLLDSRIRCFIY